MNGDEFRRYRKRLGLTQVGLADRMGTTSTTVARWERGEVPIWEPVAQFVRLLAKVEGKGAKGRRKGGR